MDVLFWYRVKKKTLFIIWQLGYRNWNAVYFLSIGYWQYRYCVILPIAYQKTIYTRLFADSRVYSPSLWISTNLPVLSKMSVWNVVSCVCTFVLIGSIREICVDCPQINKHATMDASANRVTRVHDSNGTMWACITRGNNSAAFDANNAIDCAVCTQAANGALTQVVYIYHTMYVTVNTTEIQ